MEDDSLSLAFRVANENDSDHRRAIHRFRLDELIERWGAEWPFEAGHVYPYLGDADRARVPKLDALFRPFG